MEKPDTGTVTVAGRELSTLSKAELRKMRRKIGMVFQQFNLLESKTVFQNVAIPLILEGIPKEKITERVKEVLHIVELHDKRDTYVTQLSGGQKQRVGIARALATEPAILLCDEATSALDPKTTESILGLLKRINKKMGVTILLITHQMQVIQMICNKVAVMGKRADRGTGNGVGCVQPASCSGDTGVCPHGYQRSDPQEHSGFAPDRNAALRD